MINSNNIDRNDAAINTKAPFMYGCPLMMGGSEVPPGSFLSIKVYCTERIVPPVRLASVALADSGQGICIVGFESSDGTPAGSWRACLNSANSGNYVSAFLRDENNRICGHVVFDKDLPGLLLSAIRGAASKVLRTDPTDFILLPQCHVSWFTGVGGILEINGERTAVDTNVFFDPPPDIYTYSVDAEDGNGEQFIIDVSKPPPEPPSEGIPGLVELRVNCVARVNGVNQAPAWYPEIGKTIWIGGKHLVIMHKPESNLRVTRLSDVLKFSGVREVSDV